MPHLAVQSLEGEAVQAGAVDQRPLVANRARRQALRQLPTQTHFREVRERVHECVCVRVRVCV